MPIAIIGRRYLHAPISLSEHRPDSRTLRAKLAPYAAANTARSLLELALTALPFALLWMLTHTVLQAGYFVGLLLTIPAGVLLLRLFLIQHDCGHGAFFRRRTSNDWVGRVLGVLTLTPYDCWRRSHAIHHASTGNLAARGVGDVDTLTVAEFQSRSRLQRLLYRVYRSPLVLFGLGPAYLFLLRHRLPIGMMRRGSRPWLSAMGTNLAIAGAAGLMIWLVGFEFFLLIHLPITLVAATLGVWFFYVQHQFEETVWDQDDDWAFHTAALYGSSYYKLPRVLRWMTADVGIHHVHHLASRIPFYRLNDALEDLPVLAGTSRVGIRESFRCVRMVLWDEQKRRLVSFADARLTSRSM